MITLHFVPFRSCRRLLFKFWTLYVFESLFGGLGTTYDDYLRFIRKRVMDFLLVLSLNRFLWPTLYFLRFLSFFSNAGLHAPTRLCHMVVSELDLKMRVQNLGPLPLKTWGQKLVIFEGSLRQRRDVSANIVGIKRNNKQTEKISKLRRVLYIIPKFCELWPTNC